MKRDRTSGKILIVSFIALVVAINGMSQGSLSGGARVIRLKGNARYTTGNYSFQPIHVGQILGPGSVIQTSADEGSYVDLALGDDKAPVTPPAIYKPHVVTSMSPMSIRRTSEPNVVRVWGDSALGIDRLGLSQTGADLVSDTQLDLKRGRITANVKKLSAGSKYEVKMPNGVAGVRGTFFDMQASGVIKVYVGSMVVAWVDPKTQAVTTQTVVGGQSYDAPDKELTALAPDLSEQVDQLSAALAIPQPEATTVTVAPDKTVIGMSPVGAAPETGGATPPPSGQQSSGAGFSASGHP